MRDVWGEGDHVQCIHPGSACVATSDHVAESWKVILGGDGGSFTISLEDVRVTASDSFGVVTCTYVTHIHIHTTQCTDISIDQSRYDRDDDTRV